MRIIFVIDEKPHYFGDVNHIPMKGDEVKVKGETYTVSLVEHNLDTGDVSVYLFTKI